MEKLQILEKELKMIKNRTLNLELDLIHKVKQQNMSVNNLVNQNRNELEVNLLQRINNYEVQMNQTLESVDKENINIKNQINKLETDFDKKTNEFETNLNQVKKINSALTSSLNETKVSLENILSDLDLKLNKKIPNKTISILASQDLLEKFFDSTTGIGFDDFDGWYLCNGQNDTPDLRGRFLVGLNENLNDYSLIGKLGGLESVRLSQREMPKHTHMDDGHRHKINLNTLPSSTHSHQYMTFHPNYQTNNDLNQTTTTNGNDQQQTANNNLKLNYFINDDNIASNAYYVNRTTRADGAHIHHLNGDSDIAYSSLEHVGNDKEHENRPPYFVIQYIIYFQK
jgi:microcystin-dependent protein